MKNVTKKASDAHKKTLKEEISENFMEKFKQNVKDAIKKFEDTKNKEHEKTLK
jgi:ribosomal protein S7